MTDRRTPPSGTDQTIAAPDTNPASAPTLAEIQLLTCDGCGCTLQALAVWDIVEIHVAPPMALPLAA